MAVFSNCSVLLDLKNVSFKERRQLKSAITDNGGQVSFVVNKQCTLIVTSDVSNLSSNRLRSIQKHQTPVVGAEYLRRCLDSGELLPVDRFKLDPAPPAASSPGLPPPPLSVPTPATLSHPADDLTVSMTYSVSKPPPAAPTTGRKKAARGNILENLRLYNGDDSDLLPYPQNFQVAKYSIFERDDTWCVLELQSVRRERGRQVRAVRSHSSRGQTKVELMFPPTCEEGVEVFQALRDSCLAAGLQQRDDLPPQVLHLVSLPLQELLLEEGVASGSISQEVALLVELLWTEALGRLHTLLLSPINQLSLNDVSRAEGLLLQAQRKLKAGDQTQLTSLREEFYTLLRHRETAPRWDARLVSQKLDLCQLLRDVLGVSEMSPSGAAPSSLGKFRALRCRIECVPPDSPEFGDVVSLLHGSKLLQIRQVLRVGRAVELQTFRRELGNVTRLLHSSSPTNFVGILSRGLLLPRVGVEHHGIERTDVGNLGSGIYFSDDISTSLKYSCPGETDGSRLLLLCDVALGSCRAVRKKDVTLTEAPQGHHSVQGVRSIPGAPSDFEDNEFVVYSPDQVTLRYVVQFSVEGEELKEFTPQVDVSALPPPPPPLEVMSEDEDKIIKEEVKAGLLDSAGQQLPLQAVHVKCKLIDLLSQVVIFQKYTNLSSVPIEAKYVFPLDDNAAVCGFEAFINGKHVVGKVKEKEAARREYKQAIEKGHGAYLMDQDAPDVFTISVGNLPPGATVLIKVTFVSELVIRDGNILFSLPGSVAPWQERAGLNQTTQVTVEKVCVTDETASTREFTLDVSISMPNEISKLECLTHRVKTKTTACKAVLSVLPGQVLDVSGFQLSMVLSEVHLPRMWVEQHSDNKDSQACMLVFYPNFDAGPSGSESTEVVLLLDTSESMRGRCLLDAQKVALQVLRSLPGHKTRVNVVSFGTDHTDAFLSARPIAGAYQGAESFIKNLRPVGGSTELWRPLRALSLLPPSRGVRNLLLLSDGHVQNAHLTLKLLRDNVEHSRLFTCGLSPTANRHMLRALAQAGGGAYEFFDTKTKHNWAEKVQRQVKRISAPSCSSVSVKWQQFNPAAPPPAQAPKHLNALFNDCHTLVYGFVPHCTQATLHGNLNGQELATMVSTSELMKTRGTFLHKLTARALIRDYEDGSLDMDEAEHEGKKEELKSYVTELSKEFSILCQFTSFVAVEERDSETPEDGFTDIPKLIAEEDVDFLPYIGWKEDVYVEPAEYPVSETSDQDMGSELLDYDDDDEATEPQHESAKVSGTSEEDMDMDRLCYCALEAEPEPRSSVWQDEGATAMSDVVSPTTQISMSPELCAAAFIQSRPEEELGLDWLSGLEAGLSIYGMSAYHEPSNRTAPPPLPLRKRIPLSLDFRRSSAFPPPPPPQLEGIVMGSTGRSISSLPGPRRSPQFRSAMSFSQSLTPPTPAPPPPPPPAVALDYTQPITRRIAGSAVFGSGGGEMDSEFLGSVHRPLARTCSTPSAPLRTGLGVQMRDGSGPGPEATPTTIDPLMFAEIEEHAVNLVQRRVEKGRPKRSFFAAKKMRALPLDDEGDDGPPQTNMAAQMPLLEEEIEHSRPPAYAMKKRRQRKTEGKPGGDTSPPLGETPASPRERRQPLPGGDTSPPQGEETPAPPTKPSFWTVYEDSAGLRRAVLLKMLFKMQHPDGYWTLTNQLGLILHIDVDSFVGVALKNKGLCSLGVNPSADILKLLATLLVLQVLRLTKSREGKLLRTLFCLEDSPEDRPKFWEQVKKAVDWVRWADRQYPCICSRLELGLSWESVTRQLLGSEDPPPSLSITMPRPAAVHRVTMTV